MQIISFNVNGIRAIHKKGLFLPFVEKYKPDIICLQEIKAQKHQIEVDLPDYEEYYNPAEKPGYSGTAIISKIKPLKVIFDLPENIAQKYDLDKDKYGNPNKEGRVLTAEFEKFFLVTVYTPNSKGDLSRLSLRHNGWDPAFLEYIKDLEKEKPVIFCGDLNVAHKEIDLANPKQNEGEHGFTKEERDGFQKVLDSGFLDSFRIFTEDGGNYTWWTNFANSRARNIGWRIDYFVVSEKLKKKIKSNEILSSVMGSDHCPISLEIDI
jgi:exodeoxyribonuclease-3